MNIDTEIDEGIAPPSELNFDEACEALDALTGSCVHVSEVANAVGLWALQATPSVRYGNQGSPTEKRSWSLQVAGRRVAYYLLDRGDFHSATQVGPDSIVIRNRDCELLVSANRADVSRFEDLPAAA